MALPLVSHLHSVYWILLLFNCCTGGEDYVTTEKNLTFAFGFSTKQCLHIPILNDECLEEDMEAFNVSISSEIDFVTFGVDEITVYIIDDDSKSIR